MTPTAASKTQPVHGTVRISLPASVAYDPNALKKTIGELMQRVGCRTCFSGADCMFSLERDFAVDPQEGGILAHLFSGHRSPDPMPWAALSPDPVPWVVVSLSSGVRSDIQKVFQAVDKAISFIGACPCHSGFNVAYLNEVEVIGINDQLQAQQYGGEE